MPDARLNLYFNPLEPKLYMSSASILTIQNQKYIKATLSNDATNNSAIVKYDDTNYFPESFLFYNVDVANNQYMFVIETRKDRASSTDNVIFLCFPVSFNVSLTQTSLSDFLEAISKNTAKKVTLEISEIMKNDDTGYFTGVDDKYVYVSNNTITVKATPAMVSGLTDKMTFNTLYNGLNTNRLETSVNTVLKESTLQTIMDCEAATGDDMTDTQYVNVNATITREQLMSNTLTMIFMFAGIIFIIISVFDNLMYSLFSIIDFLHKYKTVLKNDENKYLLGLCSLLFGYLFITTATFMLIFSVRSDEGSFLWGALVLYGLYALLYFLYKGRNGEFHVNGKKITVDEEILKGLFGLFTFRDEHIKFRRIISFCGYLGLLVTTLVYMFSDTVTDDYNNRKTIVIWCLVSSCFCFLGFMFS